MGKKKLKRFKELESLDRVIQPDFEEVFRKDYRLKGRWAPELFGNDHPVVLELGCGKGEYTLGLARLRPDYNFIGVDIKGARIWKGANMAHEEKLNNVAFLRTRIDFITSFFKAGEVNEIWITFPDPQSKKKRRKKRLSGDLFLNRYRSILKDGGRVNLKTDNEELYLYTRALVSYNELEILKDSDDVYKEDWDDEVTGIQTYYESRFLAGGSRIHFISFTLPASKEIKALPEAEE
ncbi:MAG: tRNA (guanosine(46)-N7)-methyltransferase TrmB [Bacteroidetes bacterium]|nr:MAG: tRNA (guanosine(46)-N7)-methyltransferase TrmB [Bacteroidota bacterium]